MSQYYTALFRLRDSINIGTCLASIHENYEIRYYGARARYNVGGDAVTVELLQVDKWDLPMTDLVHSSTIAEFAGNSLSYSIGMVCLHGTHYAVLGISDKSLLRLDLLAQEHRSTSVAFLVGVFHALNAIEMAMGRECDIDEIVAYTHGRLHDEQVKESIVMSIATSQQCSEQLVAAGGKSHIFGSTLVVARRLP